MAKILMVSTDKKILIEGSAVRERMKFIGQTFDELHIIVLGGMGNNQSFANLHLYPMSRLSSFLFGIQNIDVDIVSSQDPFETGLIAQRIARSLKAKLNVQIHTDFLSTYFEKSSLKNWIRVRIAKNIIPKAHSIRVVSKRIKNSLVSSLGIDSNKISILPVFIDPDRIANAKVSIDLHKKYPQFNKIILMASRITEEKDFPTALSAFKETIKKSQDICLLIVGEGPQLSNIIDLAKKQGIEKSVIFEPWTNDLPSYYKTSDVFLLTSLFEGYGMTLVEAMIIGIPVVSTDVGIAPDIAFGGVCPVGDFKCLSERIISALNVPRNSLQFVGISKEEYLANYARTLLI